MELKQGILSETRHQNHSIAALTKGFGNEAPEKKIIQNLKLGF